MTVSTRPIITRPKKTIQRRCYNGTEWFDYSRLLALTNNSSSSIFNGINYTVAAAVASFSKS